MIAEPMAVSDILHELFRALFSDEELRWFVSEGPDGAELIADLGESISGDELVVELLSAMQANGRIDAHMFWRLRMARPQGRARIHRAEAEVLGDVADAGGRGEQEGGIRPSEPDIRTLRAVDVQSAQWLRRLAKLTKLERETVEHRLNQAEPDAKVQDILERWWPEPKDLGDMSTARVRKFGLLASLAEVVGLEPEELRERFAAAHGRTQVRNLLGAQWPAEVDEDDEEEESKSGDLGRHTAKQALELELCDELAYVTGLTERTVKRRLQRVDSRTRVRNVFPEEWPTIADLGDWSLSRVRHLALLPTVAQIVGLRVVDLEARLEGKHGRTQVRNALRDLWPELEGDEESDEGIDADELLLDVAFGDLRASQVRRHALVQKLARITGHELRQVEEALDEVDPRTRVKNIFPDEWPSLEEIGGWSAARTWRRGMVGELARDLGQDAEKIYDLLREVEGHTRVRNALANYWDEDEEEWEEEEDEDEEESDEDGDWDDDDAGTADVGQAGTPASRRFAFTVDFEPKLRVHQLRGTIGPFLLAELCGLSLSAVRERIAQAHHRSLVRKVFADAWPDPEALAGWPAARVLRLGLVFDVARALGESTQVVERALTSAVWSSSVSSIFAEDWNGPVIHATELEWDRPGEPVEPGQRALSAMRVHELRSGLGPVLVSELTGLRLAEVQLRLREAHPRSLVHKVFEEWPGVEDLGEFSVARVLRLGLVGDIAEATGSKVTEVHGRLLEGRAQQQVWELFANEWPYAYEEEEEDGEEEDDDELLDVGALSAAQARRRDMAPSIAAITELDVEEVRRDLASVHGRTRVKNVFADHWPSSDVLGSWSGVRAARFGLVGTIAEITGLDAEEVDARLAEAKGRTMVRTLFAAEWPEWEQEYWEEEEEEEEEEDEEDEEDEEEEQDEEEGEEDEEEEQDEEEGEDEEEDEDEDVDVGDEADTDRGRGQLSVHDRPIAEKTAGRALREGLTAVITDLTGLGHQSVERRLREVDPRKRVRSVIPELWDGIEELGKRSAYQVVKGGQVTATSKVIGASYEDVYDVLAGVRGRMTVAQVLRGFWPDVEDARRRHPVSAPSAERTGAPAKPSVVSSVTSGRRWGREFNELAREFSGGNLIAFVGAGVSLAAGLPSWGQLLDRIVAEIRPRVTDQEIDEVVSLSGQGKLIDAMSAVKQSVGGATFDGLVERFLAADDKEPPPAAQAIAALEPQLRAVMTTNLDTLLERAFGGRYYPYAHVVPDIGRRRRYILKLHGTLHDRSTWVFTREQYQRVMYQDPKYADLFSAIFHASPLMFVGYGLSDADFDQLLDKVRAYAGSQPPAHFALISSDSVTPYRRRELERGGVRLLPYSSANNHAELLEILNELRAAVPKTK